MDLFMMKMALFTTLLFLVNLVLIQGRTEIERLAFPSMNYTHLDIYKNALGKAHYNAWSCTYGLEPGYKCLSCSAALHCYPTDFALLVQCAGFFPYCKNGYCSRWKTEGCNEDYTYADSTHGPLRVTTASNDRTTMSPEENLHNEVTDQIQEESIPSTVVSVELTDSNKVEEIITSTVSAEIVKPEVQKEMQN